jgi:Ca2+-binding EF-hand superfamily protein
MAFNYFDKDKSGKLSAEEIKVVLGVLGDDKEGGELVKNIIKEVDVNGDGEVSYDEFKNLMKKSIK